MSRPKWRIVKLRGMWVVRQPGGGHFGAYFTWREALEQATRRSVIMRAAASGQFDRPNPYDFEPRPVRSFGFSPSISAVAQAQAATATALGSGNR